MTEILSCYCNVGFLQSVFADSGELLHRPALPLLWCWQRSQTSTAVCCDPHRWLCRAPGPEKTTSWNYLPSPSSSVFLFFCSLIALVSSCGRCQAGLAAAAGCPGGELHLLQQQASPLPAAPSPTSSPSGTGVWWWWWGEEGCNALAAALSAAALCLPPPHFLISAAHAKKSA